MTQNSKTLRSTKSGTPKQAQGFVEAARALGCDESEARFDEALKKVARHKPVLEKPSGVDKKDTEEK